MNDENFQFSKVPPYIPSSPSLVHGEFTNYPIGLQLWEYMEWYWRIAVWEWTLLGTTISDTGTPTSESIGTASAFNSPVISDESRLINGNNITIDLSYDAPSNDNDSCGWALPSFNIDFEQTVFYAGLYYPWISLNVFGYGQNYAADKFYEVFASSDTDLSAGNPGSVYSTYSLNIRRQTITMGIQYNSSDAEAAISLNLGNIEPSSFFPYSGQFNTSNGLPA